MMRRLITRLGVYTASPLAFAVLVAYAVLWYIFKPETLEWHAVATLATLGMTLVIQRAEHRDTQAIHAKLDEVLHALGDARNEMTASTQNGANPNACVLRRGGVSSRNYRLIAPGGAQCHEGNDPPYVLQTSGMRHGHLARSANHDA
jgi:hypothetical protein